jgi:hypothetical protein
MLIIIITQSFLYPEEAQLLFAAAFRQALTTAASP